MSRNTKQTVALIHDDRGRLDQGPRPEKAVLTGGTR